MSKSIDLVIVDIIPLIKNMDSWPSGRRRTPGSRL